MRMTGVLEKIDDLVEVRADPRLHRRINNGGRIVITLSKEIQKAIKDAQRILYG